METTYRPMAAPQQMPEGDWLNAAGMRVSAEYVTGWNDGYADGKLIANPVNTNGHTESEYCRVKATYMGCLGPHTSDWQQGYADGMDRAAVEAGYAEPTEDELDRFYADL